MVLTYFRSYFYHDKVDCESEHELLNECKQHKKKQKKNISVVNVAILFLVSIFGFVLGVVLQQWKTSAASWQHEIRQIQADLIEHTLYYNRTFGAIPSIDNIDNDPWNSLMPKGQGFIRYPPDASESTAIAVFHQLHCLYAIRLVVYMNTTANSDEEQILTKRHNLSQHHVQHCFDLLRQTLMCNADTTLQPYSPRIKGVTPWGYPRICKDYDQIVEFAELYRTTDRDGFGE